ncbi:glycosyltransferase [Paracoccus laeviglucosivorans]|uniref:Glycosyltransferase involved in cell wall bisynthesis n=1 Tax=Paracoccus laeviglucosivorans TaxID=1197861 RepID=A0A521EPM8_9RHOB|nr:glycosyltransferase [Paracoccus laeviglucosivorans]SMO85873.1 Glycosyltransferase involved in cell wall bisynthesis [Paracoccus laeviglucosivorans]
MKRLRIAVIAHLRHPIARPFAGGMEAHSWHLVRGLQARGHEVTLFAAGDSDPSLPLRPVLPRHYDADYPWHDFRGTELLNAALTHWHGSMMQDILSGGFDIVHNNGLHPLPLHTAARNRLAMLTSLHVPAFHSLQKAVRECIAPWSHVTACTARHLASYWSEPPPQAHIVANGIDLADWPFRPHGNGEAVWAGRITPNKGTHLAIAAARRTGMALTLFGAIEDWGYFRDHIRPVLKGPVRYGGHLTSRDLAAQIGKGSVALFTPLWDEPFGLAAIEAMACGLPVAAIRNGAVPEVIGAAGCYVAADETALATSIDSAVTIPRLVPRARVERLFTLDRMLRNYEALYQCAIDGQGSWSRSNADLSSAL